jgi:hypothetical protein
MNEVEVVGRKCKPSVQVVDLPSVMLATALSRPRIPGVRGNYGDECHRKEDSCCEKSDRHGALVIPSHRLLVEVEGRKRWLTHLEPQVIRHIVWAHVRGNIYANDLDQQLSGKNRIQN